MASDDPIVLDVEYKTGQRKDTDKFFLEASVIRNAIIPAQIYLFRRDLEGVDMFCSIASVEDINCWPPTKPMEGSPFFRLDNVTLEFDDSKTFKEVLDQFRARTARLVCDYKILVCEVDSEFTETYNSDSEC